MQTNPLICYTQLTSPWKFLVGLPLLALVACSPLQKLYAANPLIYGNSATSGPDLAHQIDKVTGALVQNFTVSTGNGRGVVVVGNIMYTTESGPDSNIFGGSDQIYMTDLTTGLPLGAITVTGLPAGAAMSTLAWDGTHFWTSEYLGGNHAYRIDTSGNIVKTIVLGLASFNMDGLEYFNGKIICNRGDAVGPYDVYDLDGNVLQSAFIAPSTIGVGNTTGIAYDGTDFYTSDIGQGKLEIWNGTTGAHKGTLNLSEAFNIEDLSVDYEQRPDTGCGGIVNGSFESDDWSAGERLDLGAAGGPVTGWTVIDPKGDPFYPWGLHNGNNSFNAGPTPYGQQWFVLGGPVGEGGMSIEQTVGGLTAGATYELSFALSTEGFTGGNCHVEVSFPSGSPTPPINITVPPSVGIWWGTWTPFSYSFVAGSSSVTIRFTDLGSPDGFDAGLDNVCLKLAPPPPCDPKINVNVFSGFTPAGGGAPYSGYVGSQAATSVSFATDTGYDWHPFGLGEFGAEISGCLDVAKDGTYNICLNSDDGSLLFIDGVLVVTNGETHGPEVACAAVALAAGKHCFKIQFFECCGGPSGVDLILPTSVALGCECPDPVINIVKFYDANANGINDDGQPINGWLVAVDGNPYPTPTSLTVVSGQHVTTEGTPAESDWLHTTPTSYTDVLGLCDTVTHEFGNLCLGAGGGMTLGFWSNKNGQALENGADFAALTALCLVNKNGSPRDFTGTLTANKKALNTWILNANAVNMAYMLSAQLTAMQLNVLHGKVAGNRLVYAPGCGNTGVGNNFITINDLMAKANAELCAHPVTLDGNPNRALQGCLKDALDRANNNLNFVQLSPCRFSFSE